MSSGVALQRPYGIAKHEMDRRTTRPSTGGASILRRDAGRRRSRHPLPDGGPTRVDNRRTTEEQLKNNRTAAGRSMWGHERPSGFSMCGSTATVGGFMTSFGIYDGHDPSMFYIELARILQSDKEREIEARLRHRRLVDAARTAETTCVGARSSRSSRTATTTQRDTLTSPTRPNQPTQATQPNQRPASTGAVSR